MTKGRKLGSTELDLDDLAKIHELTISGASRSDIAKAIRRSKKTIYNYQKKLNLV